ncbi:unnamed protein product [Ascophyllum nodosum]
MISMASSQVKMANMDDEALAKSYEEFSFWQESYRRSRGWFWSCDEQCQHNKRVFEETRQAYNALEREYQRGVAEAKSELGLFSEDGVAETRELFWTKVAGGKRFAKRATVWDAMFVSIGSFRRDEGLAAIIAKVAFRFILNLTIGLFMAVIQFLFSIWKVIWSYQPDPISTAAFFAMAALGAVSLLVAWFLGIAAAGVVGVYAVAKVAENAQIEAERRGGSSGGGGGGGYYMQQQQQQQAWSNRHNQQQQARYRRPGSAQTHTPNWNHID